MRNGYKYVTAIMISVLSYYSMGRSYAEDGKVLCGNLVSVRFTQSGSMTSMSVDLIDKENHTISLELPLKKGQFPTVNTSDYYTVTYKGDRMISMIKGCDDVVGKNK